MPMRARTSPTKSSLPSILPSIAARFASVASLVVGVAAVSLTGCATYTQDLDRGIHHYDANEHERALAVFRSLENDTDSFDGKELARYFYYRGMTDYRLASPQYEVRPDARYWLGLAHAAEDKTPGSLTSDQKQRLEEALDDLNGDVFGTGAKKTAALTKKAAPSDDAAPEKKAKSKKSSDDSEK
jgi:hypothetical protein